MEVRYDVNPSSNNAFMGGFVRMSSDGQNGYLLMPNDPANLNSTWNIFKRVAGSFSSIKTFSLSGLSGNISVRLRVQGTTITATVWSYGTTEPGTISAQIVDSSVTAVGYQGFYNQGNTPTAAVDNFTLDNLVSGAATDFTLTPSTQTTTAGTATGAYTVILNGTLAVNESIALSDSGQAGTFTPSNLTFTSANAGTPQSFTYTPAIGATGSKTLTANGSGAFSSSRTAACVIGGDGSTVIAVTNAGLFFSPGNWDHLTAGTFGVATDEMQATAPGARLEFVVTGTVNLSIQIDNTTNSGFPSADMPTLRYSINHGAFVDVQLAPSQTNLNLSSSLSTGVSNDIQVYFKASSNSASYGDIWGSSGVSPTNVLRIKSVTIDLGGSVSAPVLLPLRGIIAGDSITAAEHCSIDGSDDSTASYAASLGRALNMEVGMLGYGGQAWTLAGNSNIPAFPSTWNYYSSGRARTLTGLDFFAVMLGVNDFRNSASGSAVQTAIQSWLTAARSGLGSTTKILLIVPPSASYESNITSAFNAYKTETGDINVYLIDGTARLPAGVFGTDSASGPFQYTFDGVHPLIFGHSRIAAIYADLICAALGTNSSTGYSRSRIANA
jgi:hypothetical protein